MTDLDYITAVESSVEARQLKHVDEITQIVCEWEEQKAKGFTPRFKG